VILFLPSIHISPPLKDGQSGIVTPAITNIFNYHVFQRPNYKRFPILLHEAGEIRYKPRGGTSREKKKKKKKLLLPYVNGQIRALAPSTRIDII
jgi:hypothetical protein